MENNIKIEGENEVVINCLDNKKYNIQIQGKNKILINNSNKKNYLNNNKNDKNKR